MVRKKKVKLKTSLTPNNVRTKWYSNKESCCTHSKDKSTYRLVSYNDSSRIQCVYIVRYPNITMALTTWKQLTSLFFDDIDTIL